MKQLMRNFGIGVATMALIGSHAADAQRRGGGGRYGGGHGGGYGQQTIQAQVNQYTQGVTTIGLGRLFRLRQYDGMKIESVKVVGNSLQGRGGRLAQVSLLKNGQFVGATKHLAMSHRGLSRAVLFMPQRGSVIGRGVQSLQLQVHGRANIVKVVATLSYQGGPGGGGQAQNIRVPKPIQSQFQGYNTLMVKRELGLQRSYAGMQLKKVVLVGSSARGRGTAKLFIGGQQVGYAQTFGMQQTKIVFNLNHYGQVLIQQGLPIQVDLQGNIYVQRLVAVLADSFGGPGWGGGHGRPGRGGGRGPGGRP